MDLPAAHHGDMASLTSSQVLLHENPLGIIDMPQPSARIFGRFAKDGMDRAARRAQRVLQHKRNWLSLNDLLGLQTVARDMRFRERNFVSLAKLSRKVPFTFNF